RTCWRLRAAEAFPTPLDCCRDRPAASALRTQTVDEATSQSLAATIRRSVLDAGANPRESSHRNPAGPSCRLGGPPAATLRPAASTDSRRARNYETHRA